MLAVSVAVFVICLRAQVKTDNEVLLPALHTCPGMRHLISPISLLLQRILNNHIHLA